MTPEQVVLIRSSWQRLAPFHVQVLWLFYSRLFEIAPRLQGHLLRDMNIQPTRLAALLETAVARLDQLESLHSALRVLGRRYACCGIRDEDYNTVAEAFLWTLKQALEDRFTPALHEAWANACTTLAALMKDGAAQAQPPRLRRLRSLFGLRGVG